jgi:hypothetical protein
MLSGTGGNVLVSNTNFLISLNSDPQSDWIITDNVMNESVEALSTATAAAAALASDSDPASGCMTAAYVFSLSSTSLPISA